MEPFDWSLNGFGRGCWVGGCGGVVRWAGTHVVLGEVDEILQVNVVSVRLDVVVDEKVELIFDPVFKDEGEDPRRQLQEEDQTQEHGKLEGKKKTMSSDCHFCGGSKKNVTI